MSKKFSMLYVFIFSLFLICALAIAEVYGPYHETIFLGTPEPGIAAEDALKNHMKPLPTRVVMPGDQVILCNGDACVTYTRTNTGWVGGAAIKQSMVDNGGRTGGGGEGRKGSGGGTVVGGSNTGSTGSGTVTVLPPKNV